MARAGGPGTIRGEAAARGVTEYQIRKERAQAQGLPARLGAGHPAKGEPGLEARRLMNRARTGQLTKKQGQRLAKLLVRPARDRGISVHEAWTIFVASP